MNNPASIEEFKVVLQKGAITENCASQLASIHPLKQSEAKYDGNSLNRDLLMLRNAEGLHAPLKISMELASAKKIGRHPFLTSSNAQRDVLLGMDEMITFKDFLGTDEFSEVMAQPHSVAEKQLGIL